MLEIDPEDAERTLAAWYPGTDAEEIDGGWLRSDGESGRWEAWLAWVRVDNFLVHVRAPGYIDDDVMRRIADRIEVVPGSRVPEQPIDAAGVAEQLQHGAPVACGELSWGVGSPSPAPRKTCTATSPAWPSRGWSTCPAAVGPTRTS